MGSKSPLQIPHPLLNLPSCTIVHHLLSYTLLFKILFSTFAVIVYDALLRIFLYSRIISFPRQDKFISGFGSDNIYELLLLSRFIIVLTPQVIITVIKFQEFFLVDGDLFLPL